MKAIVTIQNKDGTYNEVGMNTRTILDYKQANFIRKRAREYAKGKAHRIEFFGGSILVEKPMSVEFVK